MPRRTAWSDGWSKRGPRPPRLADLLAWDGAVPDETSSLAGRGEHELRALAANLVAFRMSSASRDVESIPSKVDRALARSAGPWPATERLFASREEPAVRHRRETLAAAVAEALRGVDVARLEPDWLTD